MVDVAADEVAGECPSCGADVYPSDRFCEACGSDLPVGPAAQAAAPVAADQPATAVDPHPADGQAHDCGGTFQHGWCDTCGARAPDPRDHVEVDLGATAGVSDRGLRHHRNEDAMAIDVVGGTVVAVVADGVSATVDPHHASEKAVEAARKALVEHLGTSGLVTEEGLLESHASAVEAVGKLRWTPRPDLGAPSCTFLAGVVPAEGPVWIASLGDCRAYWVHDGRADLLTDDDSWAAEQVRGGLLTGDEAANDPRAHVITRWVGADADDWQPVVASHPVTGPGRLVLCTDGLWNHLGEPADLARLVDAAAPPLEVAATLAAFANDAGGHDNVTVVVVDRAGNPNIAPGSLTAEQEPS